MDIDTLKKNKNLLFESICGSRAYGTNIASSDTDLKGVFVLPKASYYGLNYTPQLSDATNDEVYYELGRFMELLSKSNPNMLELLAMPKDCILYQHPLYERIKTVDFLSKQCFPSFVGYASTQIKKAYGLNKKVRNPIPEERKNILDFCYILVENDAMSLVNWLRQEGLEQTLCGLAKVPHFRAIYSLFYDPSNSLNYKGIMPKGTSNEVALSSIPKGEKRRAILTFNQDGYSAYCKAYRAYWDWVAKRNDARYQKTIEHGKNYDAKNMMHTFRLLDMVQDIFEHGKIIVRRPNKEALLEIRTGVFTYDDLVKKAQLQIKKIEALHQKSKLPELPNIEKINTLLIELRQLWYEKK